MTWRKLLMLILYGAIPYIARLLLNPVSANTNALASNLGASFMGMNKILMMLVMAIPEQIVLYLYEPQVPIIERLLVSVAMYVIHFAWNGMEEVKPRRSYNELIWILGTALYARQVIGVQMSTAIMLVAADSIMTLSIRGITD